MILSGVRFCWCISSSTCSLWRVAEKSKVNNQVSKKFNTFSESSKQIDPKVMSVISSHLYKQIHDLLKILKIVISNRKSKEVFTE